MDGAQLFLHYVAEQGPLYYLAVNRRSNEVVIKKKCPGGPDNGGTYYALTNYDKGHPVPTAWQHIAGSVRDNPDGSVTLGLYRDGQLLQQTTDTGTGCAPIRQGAVGIRGDNAELHLDNFRVSARP